MSHQSPTNETYESLLYAYDFFNQALFSGQLPPVVFTYHRQNRVMGYASFERWVRGKDQYVDEIAINPEYFAKFPLLEICQTLAHEMVHIWQAHFGKPGRRGYHNQEWADKMKSIGLMPSSTGKPGGSKTGESMMDYVILEGRFIYACRRLIKTGFRFPLIDRYPVFRYEIPVIAYDNDDKPVELDASFESKIQSDKALSAYREHNMLAVVEENNLEPIQSESDVSPEPANAILMTTRPKAKSGRIKYICKGCQTYVWAKRGLNLGCLDCNRKFQEED